MINDGEAMREVLFDYYFAAESHQNKNIYLKPEGS
jgi:hypothetical protein